MAEQKNLCYNCFQERESPEGPCPYCGFDLAENEKKFPVALRAGTVAIAGKAFGTAAALRTLIKLVAEHPVDDAYPSYFLYTDDKSKEELLLPQLEEAGLLPQRLHPCSIGATIGTHIGPGALGLAYVEGES